MKIEIWHNIMWSRYKARVFSELHKKAVQTGNEIFVYQVAETDSDRLSLAPVDKSIHQYPYKNLFSGAYSMIPNIKLFSRLGALIWKSKADVTVLAGYDRPEYWLQLLMLVLMRRRRAVFCDSTEFDQKRVFWKGLAKRIFFSNIDIVFCYGERSANYARSYGARMVYPRCQAAALPQDYQAENVPALRAMRRSANGAIFLYVGRLSREKRIETLLRSFQKVIETYTAATLRVVGTGPQEGELTTLAASLGLSSHVVFTGAKSGDALVDEYLGATCLVLPSWSEPWGLVVNEAMHYGCPAVVSHRCGCVPELVEASDCGLVFRCDDVDDLAAKLIDAVAFKSDPERVARACLDRIRPYSPQAAAEQILAGLNANWPKT